MISLQKYRNFFFAGIFLFLIIIPVSVGQGFSTLSTSALIHQSHIQISSMNRLQATAKDIEGKVQETYGNLTGDLGDQVMGQAKQLQGQAANKANELNDLADGNELPDIS
jgi:uncharacterized protein YjbJ (UPF0337 family)